MHGALVTDGSLRRVFSLPFGWRLPRRADAAFTSERHCLAGSRIADWR